MPATAYKKSQHHVEDDMTNKSHIKQGPVQLEEAWWWKPNCGRPTVFITAPHCKGDNFSGISNKLISTYITENASKWNYVQILQSAQSTLGTFLPED